LLELIVKSGIGEAIAARLGALKGNKNAIAETIENNVRSKIIKEHLTDPEFFASMSAQLQEIIELRKARAIEYEEYLKRIGEVARQVEKGTGPGTPAQLDTPGKRALYNNLQTAGGGTGAATAAREDPEVYVASGGPALDLALKIDEVVKEVRPDGWRGVQAREQVIKQALYDVLQDFGEVDRIFLIVKAQTEY
jgi:type I restriction enzyme R subunit